MSATPYCAACWARKQRPRARYCDDCNTPHVRERNRRNWIEHCRRQIDRVKAEEVAKYRARALER